VTTDVAYYGAATVGKIEFVRLTTTNYGNGTKDPYANGEECGKASPVPPTQNKNGSKTFSEPFSLPNVLESRNYSRR
jgi:hypothetical protein